MKYSISKCLFVALAVCAMVDASAQRGSRRRGGGGGTNPSTTAPASEETQQQNNNRTPSGFSATAGIPIEYDTTAGPGVARKSLRNDNAFDKAGLTQRTPLPYEHLRWDDAFYAEKVWRELDLREKMNQTFRYGGEDDNGSQIFVDILLKAVNSGEVTAFADDRFTMPLKTEDISMALAGSADTVPVMSVDNPDVIEKYVVTKTVFDAKSVTKLRMKEEWVFDREASRFFCRILGIAPVRTKYLPSGKEFGTEVLFWVYYPDLRPTLAKVEVYNPKNMGQNRMTWEELFESRMFASYITKSTLDNSANRMIKQYVKDPILALLEGENIKEKMFNFEQDLWSY